MEVCVEVFLLGVNLLHAKAFQCFLKFLVYHLHALTNGLGIIALVLESSLKVVQYGQHSHYGLLTAVEYKLRLLLQCALLVVVKLSERAQVLVF